jgi:hypothetical protein
MQALLDVLQCFCVLFKLKVNIRKTKGMVFHPRPASYVKRCVWYYGGECIEMVDRFTYLGVIFHQSQGCLYGVDALVAQGSKAMYAAWAKVRALGITQVDMMCRVFDALVFPVVSYGCQIWGPSVCMQKDGGVLPRDLLDASKRVIAVENVQVQFLRLIVGMPASAAKWIVLTELKRLPLQLRWLILCARFWQSVLSLLDSELLYLAMVDNVQLFLQQRDGRSWMAQFLRALCCLGVVTSQQINQVTSFDDLRELDITEIKVREAIDVYCARLWVGSVVSVLPSMALSDEVLWCTYKQWVLGSAAFAPYLKCLFSLKALQSLARLRVTSYPLQVCVGRMQNVPRALRLCQLCDSGEVEDLPHFLLHCSRYSAIRAQFTEVFGGISDTAAFFNGSDQVVVAHAVVSMLQYRTVALQV